MADQLERFEEKYTDGQIIFCEYELGDSFYFIKSGNIKLVKRNRCISRYYGRSIRAV